MSAKAFSPPHWVFYVEQEGVDFIIKTSRLNFVSLALSLHYVIICKTIMYFFHNWPFLTYKRPKCGLKACYLVYEIVIIDLVILLLRIR